MSRILRFWFILLIFTLTFGAIFESIAQESSRKKISDKETFKILADSVYFYLENDINKVDLFYPQLLKIGENIKEDYLKGELLKTQAYYHKFNNHKDSAVLALKKAIDILHVYPKDSIREISVLAKVYNVLATIYLEADLYNQAIITQYKSIHLSELIHQKKPSNEPNNHYLSWAYSDLALIYSYTDNPKLTRNYFLKSIQFSKNHCTEYNYSINALNYGVYLLDIKEIDSAKYYFEIALSIFERKSDQSEMIAVKLNLAKIHIHKGDYKAAEQLCIESINESEKIGFNYYKAQGFLIISDMYLKANRLELAEKYANQLNDFQPDEISTDLFLQAFDLLADISEKKKDYKTANNFRKRYNHLTDSLNQIEIQEQVNNLNLQYYLEKKTTENENLRNINNLQKEKIKNQRALNRWIILFASSATLLLIFILIFTFQIKKSNKRLKKSNDELTKTTNELKVLNEAQQNIFAILSHDLRGPVGTAKTLLGLINNDDINLNEAEKDKLLRTINISISSTFDLIENMLYWSKNKIRNLKVEKADFNLHQFIDTLIEAVNGTIFTKEIEIRNSVSKKVNIYSSSEFLNIILRNILTNAVKYTPRAGLIVIDAKESIEAIEISVTDNGLGMSMKKIEEILSRNKFLSTKGTESEQGSGIGLMITFELIEKLGGKLEIESTEGHGTKMIVKLKK